MPSAFCWNPRSEVMKATNPANAESKEQWLDEVLGAYLDALDRGEAPDQSALLARYPDLAPELSEYFANQDQICELADQLRPALLVDLPEDSSPAPTLSVVSAEDS